MKKRIINVIKLNLILLLIFIIYYIVNIKTGLFIPCVFHEITGLKCPGCGITHMLFALINFNFKEAFFYNPLVFIYFPLLIFYYFYMLYLYIYNKKDKILIKIPNILRITVLVITILFGIIRNF